MNIAIFEDVTTDEALSIIEKDSEKYEGLYVDMDNKEERKFVKDSIVSISAVKKEVEAARIKKGKAYTLEVNTQAKVIVSRLDKAAMPLAELLDAHKEKRAKELAAEKAIQDAKDLVIQIEEDHKDAITLDKMRDFDIQEEVKAQKERDLKIAEKAKNIELSRQAHEKATKVAAEAKRKADKAHCANINLAACQDLIDAAKCDLDMAKNIIRAIAKRQVKNVRINY